MNWQKRLLVFQIPALVFLISAFIAASKAEDAPRGIVLIGWDGAQRNHINEMLAANQLPILAALAKDGTRIDIDVITGATDTKAGWAQILTGYAPDKSGVYGNDRYRPIPAGYTIFERLEKFFGPENIETAAIISKIKNLDTDGPKNAQTPGKPYYHTKNNVDLFVNGLLENEKVGAKVMEQLEAWKNKRFFIFVHFAQPDQAGHKYGENAQEFSDALKLDDLWTGKIIAKLKELKIYDKTLVYVAVDHGFDEGKTSHYYAPYVFLAANDKKVNRNGAREDIAPTILKRFGMDLSKIEPRLDGIPLDESAPDRKAPAGKSQEK